MKPQLVDVQEQTRTYIFAGNERVVIKGVVKFANSDSTHRLETSDGSKWIVPKTFLAIELDMKEWTL
jgi:hypothetical protein